MIKVRREEYLIIEGFIGMKIQIFIPHVNFHVLEILQCGLNVQYLFLCVFEP
jgi:hypothetical protein